jgi:hypothetical protein
VQILAFFGSLTCFFLLLSETFLVQKAMYRREASLPISRSRPQLSCAWRTAAAEVRLRYCGARRVQ